MKEVERHSVTGYGRQDINYNDPEGEFVYYEDYTALQQQLTATTNILKSAGVEADTVQAGVMELKDKLRIKQNHIKLRDTYIEELEQRAEAAEAEAEKNLAGAHAWEKHARRATAERDALAAENALMLADYRDIPEMRRIGAPLTPSTDAYLNAVRADTERMNYLAGKVVNVRTPLPYGSHNIFWSQCITDDSDPSYETDLREQIDAQLRAGNAGKDGSHE